MSTHIISKELFNEDGVGFILKITSREGLKFTTQEPDIVSRHHMGNIICQANFSVLLDHPDDVNGADDEFEIKVHFYITEYGILDIVEMGYTSTSRKLSEHEIDRYAKLFDADFEFTLVS